MGSKQKRTRLAAGLVWRDGKLVTPWQAKSIVPIEKQLQFRCGKCNHMVYESELTEHLKLCQPDGVKCGRCGKTVMPNEFLEHWHEHDRVTLMRHIP